MQLFLHACQRESDNIYRYVATVSYYGTLNYRAFLLRSLVSTIAMPLQMAPGSNFISSMLLAPGIYGTLYRFAKIYARKTDVSARKIYGRSRQDGNIKIRGFPTLNPGIIHPSPSPSIRPSRPPCKLDAHRAKLGLCAFGSS